MMTAEPRLAFLMREETQDAWIFDNVFNKNEYRLPEQFEPADVIVDIGAHIGSFSIACLLRDAGKVLSFEPDEANFKLLQDNLQSFPNSEQFRQAVWGSPRPEGLTFTGYPARYTGCGSIVPKTNVAGTNWKHHVEIVEFDDVIRRIVDESGPVRLVKIDAEGSEFPILESSTMLDKIQEIVGEIHEGHGDATALGDVLVAAGFEVDMQRPVDVVGAYDFWAKRN